jgi:uncharacterized protein YjiS (DUF1127 family)
MSIQAIDGSSAPTFERRPNALGRLIRFVGAVLQSRRAEQEISSLSDHYLSDIGVGRHEVAELVKRSITRDHLLQTGWHRLPRG